MLFILATLLPFYFQKQLCYTKPHSKLITLLLKRLSYQIVKIKSFEFNLRELAGSMGDFGTLFPLSIGYIAVCGLNPAGFLVMMGLANIVTGIIYRLPLPIEPMKVLAVVAIAQHWSPSMVYAAGFSMGAVWLLFSITGFINWIARITPQSVTRGIQAALGVLLAVTACKMLATGWLLGIIAIVIILVLQRQSLRPSCSGVGADGPWHNVF